MASEVGPLDTLVNNAGIVSPERAESADGVELTLAVNYLSHFLLTEPPPRRLREGARIVNVASIGQAPFDFDDPIFEQEYDAYGAYAQQQARPDHLDLGARRAPRRIATITVNALHPATLMDTKMVRDTVGLPQSSVEEGVEAMMRLITDPSLEGVSGRYFDGLRSPGRTARPTTPRRRPGSGS